VLYLYLHQTVGQHHSHLVISFCASPANDSLKFLPVKIKSQDLEESVEEIQPKPHEAKGRKRLLLVTFANNFYC